MSKHKTNWRLLRSFIVLFAILLLTIGATFAVLQSQQAVLAGNTINSATASLLVSTDNLAFNNSKPGFNFTGVVPGGAPVPVTGFAVYLKNSGSANLSLKAAISSTPSNLNNVDLTKVFLHLTRTDNTFDQSFAIKSLMDANATGGLSVGDTINATTTGQYLLRVSMAADAFNGTNGVTISGVDLVFSGTAN